MVFARLRPVRESHCRIDAGSADAILGDGPIRLLRAFVEFGPLEHAPQRQNIEGVLGQRSGLGDHGQRLAREGGQRNDVLEVVLHDLNHQASVFSAQVLEITPGNERARDVVLPMKAEDATFERLKGTGLKPRLPQTPPGMKHVEMAPRLTEDAPLQTEPALEQRHVELLSVERHDGVEAFEVPLERADERLLFVEVAHEVLPNDERIPFDETDRDQKRRGPGASREPGGFGIDERGLSRIEVFEVERSGEDPRGVGQRVEELFEGGAADSRVRSECGVALQKLAMDGGDDLAANQLREILRGTIEFVHVGDANRLRSDALVGSGIRAVEFEERRPRGFHAVVATAASLLVDQGLQPSLQR